MGKKLTRKNLIFLKNGTNKWQCVLDKNGFYVIISGEPPRASWGVLSYVFVVCYAYIQ